MEMLVRDGHVSRGYLGVNIGTVTNEIASKMNLATNRGVVISDIQPGGPASKAGFQANDVIVAIGGQSVREAGVLRNLIAMSKAGATVDVDVVRTGQGRLTLRPTLGELPDQQPKAMQMQPAPTRRLRLVP
jgi:serine protease Do